MVVVVGPFAVKKEKKRSAHMYRFLATHFVEFYAKVGNEGKQNTIKTK